MIIKNSRTVKLVIVSLLFVNVDNWAAEPTPNLAIIFSNNTLFDIIFLTCSHH